MPGHAMPCSTLYRVKVQMVGQTAKTAGWLSNEMEQGVKVDSKTLRDSKRVSFPSKVLFEGPSTFPSDRMCHQNDQSLKMFQNRYVDTKGINWSTVMPL